MSYDRLGCEHTKATVILSTSVWGSSAGLSPQRFNDWTMANVPAPLEKSSLSPMGFLWSLLKAACHCAPEKEDGIMETLRVLGYPAPSQCDHGDSTHGDRTGNPLKVPQEILFHYLCSSVFSAGVQPFLVDVNRRLKHAGFLLPFKSTFRHKTVTCTLFMQPIQCISANQKPVPLIPTHRFTSLLYGQPHKSIQSTQNWLGAQRSLETAPGQHASLLHTPLPCRGNLGGHPVDYRGQETGIALCVVFI